MLSYPLTQYMICPPAEGAAAIVLCRGELARRFTSRPVFLKASVVRSRRYGSFEVLAPSLALDHRAGPTVDASRAAYEIAGVSPADVVVAQLQDTGAGAEVMHMGGNGFRWRGDAETWG